MFISICPVNCILNGDSILTLLPLIMLKRKCTLDHRQFGGAMEYIERGDPVDSKQPNMILLRFNRLYFGT